MTTTVSVPRHGTVRSPRQNLLAACLGNTVEWYDWVLYAQFATLIAANFFPQSDPGAALLGTLAIFATGFFFRPLGGIILTSFADRWGRRTGLMVAVSSMAIGSVLIAVSPTYAAIGLAAPVILFVARSLQGFSAGGEFTSIGSYLAEVAPAEKRGLYGSLHYVSATVGALLATATAWLFRLILDADALAEWGWRIPFLIGAAIGLLTLWLRRNMEESRAFEAVAGEAKRGSFIDLKALWVHRGPVFRLFLLSGYAGIWYYTFASYMPVYVTGLGLSAGTALGISSLALLIFTLSLPFAGALSDRIGRRPLFVGCVGLSAVTAVPLFALVGPDAWLVLLAQVIALLIFGLFASIGPIAMAEQFPTEVRSLGAGLPYALGVAVFGGTAPLLLEWLASNGNAGFYPWYLAGVSAAALVAMLGIKESYRDDLGMSA